MNFRHMQLVLKVAQMQSFTKAANALKVPQPSLSQSIFALEKELGVALFNRSTNPISLTHAGEIFLSKAMLINDLCDDLTTQIKELNTMQKGKIRIGFSQNGYSMLPDILPKFCKRFGNADIKIVQLFSTLKIRQMLIDDEIDIGMLILPIDTTYLSYDIIKTNMTYLMLPISHPFSVKFKNKILPKINISDLKNEKFILPKGTQRSRAIFDEIFSKAGFKPEILCETETFDVANSIVASGVGACFSISDMIKDDKKDKVKLFDINEPSLAKTLVIAYKKDKKLSKLASGFIKMAKEYNK